MFIKGLIKDNFFFFNLKKKFIKVFFNQETTIIFNFFKIIFYLLVYCELTRKKDRKKVQKLQIALLSALYLPSIFHTQGVFFLFFSIFQNNVFSQSQLVIRLMYIFLCDISLLYLFIYLLIKTFITMNQSIKSL